MLTQAILKLISMRCWLFIITALFFQFSASFGQTIASADYRVYAAILHADSVAVTKRAVVIREFADTEEARLVADALQERDASTLYILAHETQFDTASITAIQRYFNSPTQEASFSDAMAWPNPVTLIPKRDFDRFFRHNVTRGWKSFYRKFPDSAGAFSFSRVEYSAHNNRAVVYRAVHRNGFNGNGSLFVLEKAAGAWQIRYRFSIWNN